MNLSLLLHRYDRTIWIRVCGTILTTVTSFAIRPFMAVYLYNKTGSIYYIGIILGLAPLAGIFSNLVAGGMADKYGRKPLMVWSLLLQSLPMFGFAFASTPLQFCLISVVNGLASSLYFPAANAQVSDVVPESMRAEVFALLHTALNVGAAVGPMLGLLLVSINQKLAFIMAGSTLLLNCLLVFLFIPETLQQKVKAHSAKPEPLRWGDHKLLLVLTALSLPITLLYAQVEANFPLYLQQNFANYLTIFTSLMTMNGTIVVLSAVWLARRTEKLYTPNVLLAGYILFSLVGIGYGLGPWAKSVALLFCAEVIFTIGECITFPNQQKLIARIAPENMRGRYFSIFGMNWGVAKSIGPLLGGIVFTHAGGLALFFAISALLLLAGLTLRWISGKTPAPAPAPLPLSK